MELRLVKWGYRLYFRLAFQVKRVEVVEGVNSKIDDETHFLMWDFDDIELTDVKESLLRVQDIFDLPEISILRTKENGYHAYCWKACTFVQARGIIAFTPNVDRHFLAIGTGRGYFTLRFTDVEGRGFEHVCILPSEVKSDLNYKDVNSFVEYTKAVKS